MPTIQKTLRILEFIRAYKQLNRQSPTIKEIGLHFGFRSSASVHSHLSEMQRRGWITRSRRWRGIQIVEQERSKVA